jgi:hypothetical protein
MKEDNQMNFSGSIIAGLPQKSKRANSKNHTTLKDEITCHQFFSHLH